jgi:hypothetical protein
VREEEENDRAYRNRKGYLCADKALPVGRCSRHRAGAMFQHRSTKTRSTRNGNEFIEILSSVINA